MCNGQWTFVVKTELSGKTKLSFTSWFTSSPDPFTCGYDFLVMTETERGSCLMQVAEINFLRRVAGLILRDKVRSSDIQRDQGVDPLLLWLKAASWDVLGIWLGWFLGACLWKCSGYASNLGGDSRVNWETTYEFIFLICPENASGSPRRKWKVWLGRRMLKSPSLLPRQPDVGYATDRWLLLSVI